MKDIPKVDQPIEKFVKYGSNKLDNIELLAIIIGSGTKGLNALELSAKILQQYKENTLKTVTFSSLKTIHGLGKIKACRIIAAIELGKRIVNCQKTKLIMSSKDIWTDLRDIRSSKKEHFIVFFLDVQNQIIKREIISIGILNLSIVHPREVFEKAVQYSTAQIIISHNHPSDNCTPSDEDISLTKRLINAGEILGIEIIDHVIVSSNNFYSFKENKII